MTFALGVVVGAFLIVGGCLAILNRASQPPTGASFRPIPDGVEVVDERTWCNDGEAPPEWRGGFREGMCVHEIRVQRPGATARALFDELRDHYRSVSDSSVDIQRFVTVSESDPSLVSLIDGEGW